MFGIGGTELLVIAVVLLIAVGPTRLPKLLKTVMRGYREFRKATRDLRASTGIDELMRDEDLRDLRELRELKKPLFVPPAKKAAAPARKAAPSKPVAARKPRGSVLTHAEREREMPAEGVDVAEARYALEDPQDEEAIRSAKEAALTGEDAQRVIAQKEAAARSDQDIIDAKLAAAEEHGYGEVGNYEPPELSAEDQAIVDAKIAAAASADDSDDPIIAAKLAAAAEEEPDDPIIAAKLAAAAVDDDSDDPIIAAKLAAAASQE